MISRKYTGSESIFNSIPAWVKQSVKFQRLLQAINSSPELIAAVDKWAATPNAHFKIGLVLGEDDGTAREVWGQVSGSLGSSLAGSLGSSLELRHFCCFHRSKRINIHSNKANEYGGRSQIQVQQSVYLREG